MAMKAYRRKGGDVKAQPLDNKAQIEGEDFQAGDYLIFTDGHVHGMAKAEFEEKYELVKKNYNKPKAKKVEAGT